jgi:hypothetical protein
MVVGPGKVAALHKSNALVTSLTALEGRRSAVSGLHHYGLSWSGQRALTIVRHDGRLT